MVTRDVTTYLEDVLLMSEMYFRYYGAVAHRNRKWHLGLSVGVIVGSIAAGTLLLAPETSFSTWVSAGLFFLVALMSTLMVVLDFSRRAHVAETTREAMYSIGIELRHLWHSSPDEMLDTLESLERRIDEACRNDLGGGGQKLIERCNQEAYAMLRSYYPDFSQRERDSGDGSGPTSDTAIPAVETK